MFNLTLLISALATAMVYVLASYGIVVTYRVAGVFNFAYGYQAALAAFLYWQLDVQWNLGPYVSAVLVVFAAGPLMGFVVQQVLFRQRRDALASIIITLGLGVLIDGIIQLIWGGSSQVRTVPSVFGAGYWRFGGAALTYSELGIIVSAVVIGLAVYILTSRSRLGMRMRAVVDNVELAGASGIAYGRVGASAWVIGSLLSAAAGVLLAPELSLNVSLLASLVVDSFAVAAFAGMASLPMVVLGSMLLAYLQALVDRFPNTPPLDLLGPSASQLMPFLMLAIVLLVHPGMRRTVRVVGGAMQRQLRSRATGNVPVAVGLVVVLLVLSLVLPVTWAFTGQQVAVFGLVSLSLVLLVGASGQISIAQVAFMGLSAIMMAKLAGHGVPWGIALLAGIATAAVAGLVVAVTAFRLRGLYLALITYAFAYAALVLAFQNPSIISYAGLSVNRPDFFGIAMASDRSFVVFAMILLLLAVVATGAVLRGPWGRALQTLSAGDSVASVSGLGVRGWKMAVFTVSAALAGLAGGLAATSEITVTGSSFAPEQSIFVLVYALVGGITTPVGAVIAGLFAGAGTPILNLIIPNAGAWTLVLFGYTAMYATLKYPAGFGGLIPQDLSGSISRLRHRGAALAGGRGATASPPGVPSAAGQGAARAAAGATDAVRLAGEPGAGGGDAVATMTKGGE